MSISSWTISSSSADYLWEEVTYGFDLSGNGLFVAVASSGTGNRVMTSPDGITWTSRSSAANYLWCGVTYGNGLFVAVASSGAEYGVMTSPDGITWTLRSTETNEWSSVTYGNGLFVAVAITGTGNRVMTSPDGITWTLGSSAADNRWWSVTYGNGLFVAVAKSGLGDRVMIATSSTVEVNQSTPTLETLNTQSPQIYGISPYVLTNPTSNSSGSFSYTSSNTSVATISGDTVTIVGIGSTIITATQEATADYTSASTSSTLQVNKSTPTNPVIINNNGELLYFMGTSSTYANITNNLEINDNLTTLSYKVLTGNNIQIKKTNN